MLEEEHMTEEELQQWLACTVEAEDRKDSEMNL